MSPAPQPIYPLPANDPCNDKVQDLHGALNRGESVDARRLLWRVGKLESEVARLARANERLHDMLEKQGAKT